MSLIRTDEEVALNDLLIASRESVDHCRDAAEFLDEKDITDVLRAIASQREPFIARFEQAIRAMGELPSVPDPDKEAGTMLIHHASAFLSEDYSSEVIEQRLNAEATLSDLTNNASALGIDATLLNDFSRHLVLVHEQLHALLTKTAT